MDKLKFRKSKLVEDYDITCLLNIGDLVRIHPNENNPYLAVIEGYTSTPESISNFYETPAYCVICLNSLGDPVQELVVSDIDSIELVESSSDYTIKLIKYYRTNGWSI